MIFRLRLVLMIILDGGFLKGLMILGLCCVMKIRLCSLRFVVSCGGFEFFLFSRWWGWGS